MIGGERMTSEMHVKPFINPEELVPVLGVRHYIERLGPQTTSLKEAVYDAYVAAYHGSVVCLAGSGVMAVVDMMLNYTH